MLTFQIELTNNNSNNNNNNNNNNSNDYHNIFFQMRFVSDCTIFSNFSIFILFTKLKARCAKSSCFTFVYTQLSFTLMDFKLANGS